MISVEHMQELIDKFDSGELDIRDIIEQSYFGGRADAIDEYKNRLKEEWLELDDDLSLSDDFYNFVDNVAEQLKE